jgi:hypothetical protein
LHGFANGGAPDLIVAHQLPLGGERIARLQLAAVDHGLKALAHIV